MERSITTHMMRVEREFGKLKALVQSVFVNGELKAGNGSLGNFIVYVNPYLVLKSGGYTKHYYIEGQRIVSKLGGGFDNNTPTAAGNGKVNFENIHKKVFDGIVKNLKFLGADGQILTAGKSGKIPPGQVSGTGNISEANRYFYHPDHLGSTSYVTDVTGEVYQHLEYFAFGETFVEEHSNTDRTPYLFNGKELDEETRLYYYGARYYDPRTSVWQSVDPLAEKYSHLSPFVYVANNPICAKDPDGKRIYFIPGLGYDPSDPAKYVSGMEREFEPYLGQHGTYSKTIQGSKNGRMADMAYVSWRGQAPRSNPFNDKRAVMAAGAIAADLNSNPLKEGEQFNILGTSQGSVTSANAVILLLENPEAFGLNSDIKVDNLVLAGSPLSTNSKLFKKLEALKSAGKIGNILYDDYQSKDSYGNYNDNVTGLAGTSRIGAIGRGLKFIGQIIKAVSGKGPPHPHFEAAENRATDPQYKTFGEQIRSRLSKDEIH